VATDLPFIDEHSIEIDAAPERVWPALVNTVGSSFGGRAGPLFARVLGCAETEMRGDPGFAGSTVVGFRVAEAQPPVLLDLEGEHRFSRYRLTFVVEPTAAGSTLRAATHAEFPGVRGRAYRGLVIGSGAHVRAVNRILRAIRDRTKRAKTP
jgi:hypothetical protein